MSGTAATFSPSPVVKWDKAMNSGGEMAVVEAVLSTGNGKSEVDACVVITRVWLHSGCTYCTAGVRQPSDGVDVLDER